MVFVDKSLWHAAEATFHASRTYRRALGGEYAFCLSSSTLFESTVSLSEQRLTSGPPLIPFPGNVLSVYLQEIQLRVPFLIRFLGRLKSSLGLL